MADLIPIVIFAVCVFATAGFVRVCEWLRPRGGQGAPGSAHATPSAHGGATR